MVVIDGLKPNVRAFLEVIQKTEGTNKAVNPYGVLFGGKSFLKDYGRDYSTHPFIKVPYRDTFSTAAGAYQIVHGTYLRLKQNGAMVNFSPVEQDRGAVYLLKQCGALPFIEAGDFENAVKKAAPVWASLPTSQAGQPIPLSMAKLKDYWNEIKGIFNPFSIVCGIVLLVSLLKIKNVF